MNRKYDTTEANVIYGRRLNRTMNAHGISANRLHLHSWISKSMINKLRRGEHSPTLDMILSLNEALQELGAEPVNVSISEIPRPGLNPDGAEPESVAKKLAGSKAPRRTSKKPQNGPAVMPDPRPEPEPQAEPEPAPAGGSMMEKMLANLGG